MPRKEKKFHFIYKTTNLLSGKYYIGMHSTDNLDDSYLGSGKRLRYSINKHGFENHVREILEFVDSRERLKKREKEIVSLDEIAKEECMNLIVGGEGGRGFTSEEQRLNAKKSNEKQRILRETNLEWVEKYKKNKSSSQKKAYDEGRREKVYFYDRNGKKHSEKSKEKMKESKIGHGAGSKNSQFGTCWINDKNVNKKIKKEEIENFIKEGWKIGKIVKFNIDKNLLLEIKKLHNIGESYNKLSQKFNIPKTTLIENIRKIN